MPCYATDLSLWRLGNTLDLDPHIPRVLCDLNTRPRWLGSRHEFLVNGVHPREILVHVLQEDYRSDGVATLFSEKKGLTDDLGDILQAGSAVLEYFFEVSNTLTDISM